MLSKRIPILHALIHSVGAMQGTKAMLKTRNTMLRAAKYKLEEQNGGGATPNPTCFERFVSTRMSYLWAAMISAVEGVASAAITLVTTFLALCTGFSNPRINFVVKRWAAQCLINSMHSFGSLVGTISPQAGNGLVWSSLSLIGKWIYSGSANQLKANFMRALSVHMRNFSCPHDPELARGVDLYARHLRHLPPNVLPTFRETIWNYFQRMPPHDELSDDDLLAHYVGLKEALEQANFSTLSILENLLNLVIGAGESVASMVASMIGVETQERRFAREDREAQDDGQFMNTLFEESQATGGVLEGKDLTMPETIQALSALAAFKLVVTEQPLPHFVVPDLDPGPSHFGQKFEQWRAQYRALNGTEKAEFQRLYERWVKHLADDTDSTFTTTPGAATNLFKLVQKEGILSSHSTTRATFTAAMRAVYHLQTGT